MNKCFVSSSLSTLSLRWLLLGSLMLGVSVASCSRTAEHQQPARVTPQGQTVRTDVERADQQPGAVQPLNPPGQAGGSQLAPPRVTNPMTAPAETTDSAAGRQ